MSSSTPLVSCCIPTRNRAAFLNVLLESIAAQITSEVEVIISDDASTDETASMIESFRLRLPQLVYRRVEPALCYDRTCCTSSRWRVASIAGSSATMID